MFQVVFLFLLIGYSLPLWSADVPEEGFVTDSGRSASVNRGDSNHNYFNLSDKIITVKTQIEGNNFAHSHCQQELRKIDSKQSRLLQIHASVAQVRPRFAAVANRDSEGHLQKCLTNIKTEIQNLPAPGSKKSWYSQYLAGQEYQKDFDRYPELKGQFEGEMNNAYQQIKHVNSAHGPVLKYIEFYIASHPHLKDYTRPENTLPYRYNAALKEAKTCKPKKTESCFEKLKGQLAEDSEDSLKGMCNQALQEGQVCCANPNKSCGDLAFAKDITRTFAQNLPGVGQAFANLAAIKGNMAEACKLSQLGSVVGPLGNLQLNSCNKAIDGCRETCQSRLDKFKQDFKKCYNISEKESLSEVIRKASLEKEEEDEADPRSDCQEQIKKIAELYKQGSLESRYSLKEDSDHEELISCYGEIEQYAPGGNNRMARQGGMDPTQQLAVNMCYSQLGGSPPPSGPPTMPRNPVGGSAPLSVGGFAGGGTTTVRPPATTFNEGDSPLAGRDIGDEIDSPMGSRMKPTGANELKFRPPQNEGGPGGGGALAGGGTGGSTGGGDGKGRQAGASGGIGSGKQLPFYTGDVRDGTSNGDSWGPEADSKYLRHKRKAEQLKKLPRKYLTEDERDLVKMFSPPGKYESIFERASFALHWFCRHYGCVGYNEAMGITYPEIDPYSFLLLPEPANAL